MNRRERLEEIIKMSNAIWFEKGATAERNRFKRIIAEEKAKWEDVELDNKFGIGVQAGIEAIEFRLDEIKKRMNNKKGGVADEKQA